MRSTSRFVIQLVLLASIGGVCETVAAERSAAAVYRCHINGVLTFTDRPCGPVAELHELDTSQINTFEASALPKTPRPAAGKPKRKQNRPAQAIDPAKRAQTCERLTQSLKEVRSKMRAGYKASEGERLKERQAKLKSQLRLARCS